MKINQKNRKWASRVILIFVLAFFFSWSAGFSSELEQETATGSQHLEPTQTKVEKETDQCTNGQQEALVEDDGGFETALSPPKNVYIVSCIAPSNYPSFLVGISEYTLNSFNQRVQFSVFVDEDGDGPDGQPFWESHKFRPNHHQWNDYDLTGETEFEVPITQGSWCIGFVQSNLGVNEAHDTSSAQHHTWAGSPGNGWINVDVYAADGNGGFRGLAEYCPDECGCFIDDECYGTDEVNPDNPCLICDPDESIVDWANNDGDSCNDGVFCNGTDTCLDGNCTEHSGDPCVDDEQFCNGTESCDEDADQCAHSGNPCPIDDGLFCNGSETDVCRELTDDCGHSGDPCGDGFECDEESDSCDEIPDDDDDTGDDDDTFDDDDSNDDDEVDDDTDDDSADDDSADDDSADDDSADDDSADDDSPDDDDIRDEDASPGDQTEDLDIGIGGRGCGC